MLNHPVVEQIHNKISHVSNIDLTLVSKWAFFGRSVVAGYSAE